jgi:hypothetical protein
MNAVARRNRTGMEKSRTLVLVATMRSPTIGSPDQTHLRALLRREAPTSASDRTPIFPHARASRTGPQNSFESDQSCSSKVTTPRRLAV